MHNGPSISKAELQAVLDAALSTQSTKFDAALSAQSTKFDAALSAQSKELHAALSAQSKDLHAALSAQSKRFDAALSAQSGELRTEFRTALSEQKDELTESIRQIETNLLTEFHRYAKGQQVRMHTLESNGSDVVLRLATIEDRLLALESRMPPTVFPPSQPPAQPR